MSLPRNAAPTSATPALFAAALSLGLSSAALAGQDSGAYVGTSRILPAASRCADFGPEFVDMGNGTCGRASNHVRVGTRNANVNAWSTDGTSNAGLRSDSRGMVPGAGDATHLRVRSGLDPLSLFR